MKKYLKYFAIFLIIIFVLPAICTKRTVKENKKEEVKEEQKVEESKQEEATYNYSKYKTIKLYHTATEKIEEVPFDEYLYGTVSAEMPASYDIEALKAQAVVSRTYTLYQIMNGKKRHKEANICDNYACCQAWISKEDRLKKWKEDVRESNWKKITEAVNSTSGKIITYKNKPIDAFFHSNSGGKTETTVNVWGGSGYPYLQSVSTSGEEAYTQYKSEVTLNKQTFIDKIKEKHNEFEIDFETQDCIKILEYTDGERVKKIKVGNLELSGVEIRTILGLKSANFEVIMDESDNITFKVKGYGHGVGMSQTGADSMAKQGSNFEEIIKHFYTGVEIQNI